jgi:hypothetical protein
MNRFAELLDRLAYEPARNNKLRLMTDYFRSTADPERGWALAALTGALSFPHAKPGLIRSLIAERTDPVLFELSYDYVGDLSETVALMWPTSSSSPASWGGGEKTFGGGELTLTAVIETLSTLGKAQLPQQLARWLDALDETGRWALIKLVTGGLRIGVSARLAKAAVAALGDKDAQDIELLWPGLAPPYVELFAWLEGRGDKPANAAIRRRSGRRCWRMRSTTPILPRSIRPISWPNGNGTASACRPSPRQRDGAALARLYSRTGEDISKSFPDLIDALRLPGAIDGELLIMRDRRVQSFNVLQQRLNRKTVTPKLIAEFPAHLRAYDLLADGERGFARTPFAERRRGSKQFIAPARRTAHRSVAAGVPSRPGTNSPPREKSGGGRRRRMRCGRRRHAQAARCALSARPAERPVVEMEARSVHRRCGADVRPARPRQTLVVLFRLHVRRLDARRRRRRAGSRSARPISASPTRSCFRHLFERPARARREIERIGQPERQPLGAGPGDHGAVVGAQSRRRRDQRGADLESDRCSTLRIA